MKNEFKGLLKIIEIEHVRNSKVLWSQKNLRNTLHNSGEIFLLQCCFDNNGTYPPSSYFFGLDNRATILKSDEIDDLTDEPVGSGYLRQSISSNGGFTIEEFSGGYRATSSIMSFSAVGTGWGPVRNMFMATSSNNDGILVSSIPLSQEISLINGDSINLRMSLSLT